MLGAALKNNHHSTLFSPAGSFIVLPFVIKQHYIIWLYFFFFPSCFDSSTCSSILTSRQQTGALLLLLLLLSLLFANGSLGTEHTVPVEWRFWHFYQNESRWIRRQYGDIYKSADIVAAGQVSSPHLKECRAAHASHAFMIYLHAESLLGL